jgi:hypothetical protein
MSLIFCAPAAAGVKRKLKQQQANDYFFNEITLKPFQELAHLTQNKEEVEEGD